MNKFVIPRNWEYFVDSSNCGLFCVRQKFVSAAEERYEKFHVHTIEEAKALCKYLDELDYYTKHAGGLSRDLIALDGYWEIQKNNLQDEIDAWKDAANCAVPQMLKPYIANLKRNVEALDKSSAITIQQRDKYWLAINGLECKNLFWSNVFNWTLDIPKNCGYCDICIAKTIK